MMRPPHGYKASASQNPHHTQGSQQSASNSQQNLRMSFQKFSMSKDSQQKLAGTSGSGTTTN